jgi:hypothetical protein
VVLKLLRKNCFDLLPRKPTCQYFKGIDQNVDVINADAEKVDSLHIKISEKVSLLFSILRESVKDLDIKANAYSDFHGFIKLAK